MVSVIFSECSHCQGEGVLLSVGRPGEFSSSEDGFLPSEVLHVCPDCAGEGVREVCAECLQPVAVVNGREVCACAVAWLDAA